MLAVLKYVGLLVAAASSIWGTLHELTETRDGKKRLKPAGYAAIALIIVGLTINLVSSYFEKLGADRAVRLRTLQTMLAAQHYIV